MTSTPERPLPDPDDEPVIPVKPTGPLPDPDDQVVWPSETDDDPGYVPPGGDEPFTEE